ncbi:NIPSNAP family protein [Paenibacillus sp. UMB7766-LJ446]|uniref:NIPSNAP family protein n=1 Tax=Paenibacillus sp. UMB7766-LJ446 TaxID=3046313 RepID=UPI00254C537F|nr:NIPSNAP family protein [Paenibacillus sp. UMB7766-LJ446]MDK8193278.1 NIPSNAP family protein [Paenibacillus sp. UMB7766-LJ446]
MIYRRKTYVVASSFVEEFNALFNDILLPSQLKYGARLIGRWHTLIDDETSEIFAMWEYDTLEQYEEIEKNIKSDNEHVIRVQERFDQIGRNRYKEVFRKDIKQEFFESTVDREKTILKTSYN